MAKEIERKFLVRNEQWRQHIHSSAVFKQAYIICEDSKSLRVRISDEKCALLTLKIGHAGLSRDEFEYGIPLADGLELMSKAVGAIIEKTRHRVDFGGYVWEVDVFEGAHAGLIVAEVELENAHDMPPIPPWIGKEVTGEKRYSNQELALNAAEGECKNALLLHA